MKTLSRSLEYSAFLDKCSQLPLSEYLLTLGKPIPHWSVTIGLPKLTRLNNLRIRLLVGCDCLEADACRFRARKYLGATGSAICRLCGLEPEDPAHFIARCTSLSLPRASLLQDTIPSLAPLCSSDPVRFVRVILGVDWIADVELQRSIIYFLDSLRQYRNKLLVPSA